LMPDRTPQRVGKQGVANIRSIHDTHASVLTHIDR
jgi:hypothetical protein